jgi:hypothetical protein
MIYPPINSTVEQLLAHLKALEEEIRERSVPRQWEREQKS